MKEILKKIKEKVEVHFFMNGDIFEGEWKNDKKNGKGIKYYINGDREMGDFENDKRVGNHVALYTNGRIISSIYTGQEDENYIRP